MHIKSASSKRKLFDFIGYGLFRKNNNDNNHDKKIRPLSNFDIYNYMNNRTGKHRDSDFIGVFSRDEVPTKIHDNQSMVINMEDSEKSGSHWVCIYNSHDDKFIEYFDSYGLPPPEECIKSMKSTNKIVCYNTSQIQGINSILCGYYCMYYINERDNGKSMYDIIYTFEQINGYGIENNSSIIVDYFNLHI